VRGHRGVDWGVRGVGGVASEVGGQGVVAALRVLITVGVIHQRTRSKRAVRRHLNRGFVFLDQCAGKEKSLYRPKSEDRRRRERGGGGWGGGDMFWVGGGGGGGGFFRVLHGVEDRKVLQT